MRSHVNAAVRQLRFVGYRAKDNDEPFFQSQIFQRKDMLSNEDSYERPMRGFSISATRSRTPSLERCRRNRIGTDTENSTGCSRICGRKGLRSKLVERLALAAG